jgi:hypothetical protein
MRRVAGVFLLAVAASFAACSRAPRDDGADAARVAPAGPVASATPADAGAKPPAEARWSGTYASASGSLYIPPDWKGVRWSVPEVQAGIGEGPIDLTIDSATGRVTGAVDGPLGPATLDGFANDGGVTATIVRKDPSDRGFTGTLVGAVESGKLTGAMNVAAAEVSAVRKATFTLAQGKAE